MQDMTSFEAITKLSNIKSALEQGSPVTSIQFESDILGATKGQADMLIRGIPNLKPDVVDQVTLVVGSVAVKLSALRYHAARFNQIQENRTSEILKDERFKNLIKGGLVIAEKDMLFEFESFMFQLKSALDMLVKLFVPVFGSNKAEISTYGKAGEKVITHLEQLKRNKKKNIAHARVDLLIEHIRLAREPWLKHLIALRDTISHYTSFIRIGFTWDASKDELRVPMANVSGTDYPLIEVINKETEHLIDYSSQFIAGTILCAIPVTTRYQPLTEMEKKYVSAQWGIDMSRATIKLASRVIFDYTDQDVRDAEKKRLDNMAKLLSEA